MSKPASSAAFASNELFAVTCVRIFFPLASIISPTVTVLLQD